MIGGKISMKISKSGRMNIAMIAGTLAIIATSANIVHAGANFNSKGVFTYTENGNQIIFDASDFQTLYERCK